MPELIRSITESSCCLCLIFLAFVVLVLIYILVPLTNFLSDENDLSSTYKIPTKRMNSHSTSSVARAKPTITSYESSGSEITPYGPETLALINLDQSRKDRQDYEARESQQEEERRDYRDRQEEAQYQRQEQDRQTREEKEQAHWDQDKERRDEEW